MTDSSHDRKGSLAGMNAAARVSRGLWLRRAVLVLAVTESLLLIVYIGFIGTMLWSSDPWSRAIGQAVVTLAAIPLVLFVLPALIMGIVNRWLWVALLLLVVVMPAAILLSHFFA